jgi:hypothetical protein
MWFLLHMKVATYARVKFNDLLSVPIFALSEHFYACLVWKAVSSCIKGLSKKLQKDCAEGLLVTTFPLEIMQIVCFHFASLPEAITLVWFITVGYSTYTVHWKE